MEKNWVWMPKTWYRYSWKNGVRFSPLNKRPMINEGTSLLITVYCSIPFSFFVLETKKTHGTTLSNIIFYASIYNININIFVLCPPVYLLNPTLKKRDFLLGQKPRPQFIFLIRKVCAGARIINFYRIRGFFPIRTRLNRC